MILFWVVHLLHCVVQTSEPALFSTLLRTSKSPNAKTMDVSLTLDNARTCMLDTTNLHSMNMRVCGAEHSNTLSFLRERPNDFLFAIKNTTLSLESLSFDGRNSKICQGTTDTFCTLSNCVVDDCGHHAVFESDGWLSAISSKFTLPIGMTSHGLVHSPSETCHFVLSGSIFQDWRTTERTSLTGTAFEQLDLSFSQFSNVSQTHSAFLQPLHRTFQSTSIVGCDVREVENDLYGSISRDMNNHNLIHAANTTFSRNFHSELNAYTTTYTTTINAELTGQNTFSSCLFTGCSSTTSGGGLTHNSAASISISSSKFESCSATPPTGSATNALGGGCFLYILATSATLSIVGTDFVSCSASYSGGFHMDQIDNQPIIDATLQNVLFTKCKVIVSRGGFNLLHVRNPTLSNITCVDITIPRLEAGGRLTNASGLVTISSLLLLHLTSYENSGFAVDHCENVAFSNVQTASCTTDIHSPLVVGGYITGTGSDAVTLTDCYFEHNCQTSNKISGSSDISLHGESVYASKATFQNCWTASGQPSVFVNVSQHSDWIVTNEVIHVANATGEDKMFCWVPGSRCQTMTDVIGNRLGPWYVGKIAMGEGEYRETKLGMKNQTLVVEGSGKTKTTMIDGGSSETLFIITTGQLTASKIQFVPSASSHLITLSDDGTVSISDSCVETVEANVKLSKAVFSVSAGTLRLAGVDCSSLSFTDTTVLFLFSSLTRSLTLTNSSFSSISSDGSGSCICSTIATGQSVSIGEEGGSDSFSSCSSVGDGGALNVKLMDTGSLRIVSTRFSECTSNGVGGGLFVELDSTTSQTGWSLDLSGASFGTDSAKNTATKGSNLFVSGKFFETVVTPSIFPSLSETEEGDMWGVDSNTTVSSSLLVYLMPFSNTAIVGGSNAFDIDDCGHFGVGCVSIQNALDQVKTSESESLVLSFESGATLRESFSFETSQTVFFESYLETSQTITVLTSGGFTVSSGTLSLNTLTFSTAVSTVSSSLISLNGGSLSVTDCTFTGFNSSASGAIMSGTLSTSSSLVVSGSSFVSCSSSLNGGAISVSCAPNTPSSSLVIKASFSSCSCGDGQNGDWVFVSGSELSKLVVPSNWEVTTSGLTQPTDSSKVWGVDSLASGSSLASSTLLVYLIDHSSGWIFTSSSSGSEEIGCGESSTPCRTLSTSLSHLSSAASNTLTLTDSSELDFTLASTFPVLTITGSSSPLKPLSVTSPGRFSVPSNELSLAHLAISPSLSPFSLSLFAVSGTGSLWITSCTISGFSSSSSSKVLSGTIGTGQTISILDTSFVSCSATSASGIVDVAVSGAGELRIEGSTKFESCSLTDHGHLVLVQCADLPAFIAKNTISVLKPTRPTSRLFTAAEKEAFWGKEGNGKECSLLFVWFAHTTGDLHVHSDGEDDGRCGEDVLPCSSMSHGMDKMKNGVVLVDSAFAQTSLLTSVGSTWTLRGEISRPLTLSGDGGFEVKDADTVLTLSALNIVTGSVGTRTTSALSVSVGKVVVSSCTFGVSSSDFVLPVCSVDGGTVEFSPSLSVIRPSPSMPMLSVSGGSLVVNEFALTHSSTARTSPLLAVLAVTDSTSIISSDLNLVSLNGGSVEVAGSKLTFTRPSCLLGGSGYASIVSSSLKCEDAPISSNSGSRCVTLTLSVGQSLKIGEEDKEVSFEGWTSTENGGALGVSIAGGSLLIAHTTFSGCSSSLNGGAICVVCVPNTPSSSLVIKASFSSCSCGDGQNGDWVFVSGSELSKLVVPSNWEVTTSGLTQPTDSSKVWGVDSLASGSSLASSTLLVYLIDHSSGWIFTSSSSGSEEIGCGESSTPCRTLSTSLSHLSSAASNTLTLTDSSELDFTLASTFPVLTITGSSSPLKPLSVTSPGRFSVPSNELSLAHLAISPSSPFPLTLISISESGIVAIVSCSFSSFTLSNSPLIDHQNGELSLKSSSFSNIHRSEGSGSCLHSALDGDMTLEVDDVWMDDVGVSDGKGDGFFISFPSTLSSNVASFTLTNLHFASSPNQSSNANPHFLFLTGFNLSSWIGVGDSRFSGSFEGKGIKTEWLWTEDEHAEIGLSASLLFYLTEHIGPVGVDESGYDIAKCGYQSVWCPTLPSALAKLPSSGSSTVVVQVRVEINETIDFSSSTIICGRAATSQLVVEEDAHFKIQTVNVNVEVSTLVITLPSELSSSCLFIATEGSLTFTTVSFVSSDPANVFSSQLIHSAAPLSLTNVNVSSASLSGVALIESWSDVVVDGCHFTSISRSTGLGSVIEANISESTKMKVTDSTFEDCVCGSTVNWIVLKGLNTATKTHSSWEGSFSLSSPRSGVMVDSDEHEPFSLIFVLYPRGASLVVSSSSGIDHRLCGNESVACETIAGSASESGERSFSVRGSCLMGGELMIEAEGLTIEGLNSNVGTLWMEGGSRIVQNVADYPKPVTLRHVCVDVSSSTLDSESSILHLSSGTLDVSSCSFKSSKAIGTRLVWMTKGTLKLHTVSLSSLTFSTTPIVLSSLTESTLEHVTISDCSATSIISGTSLPSLTLQNVVVERVQTLHPNIADSDASKVEALCHWTGGVVALDHCTTVVRGSQFSDLSEGGFRVDGGSVEIHSSTFEETHDESLFFPSAHRNIVCMNEGRVIINSPNGGDGSPGLPSLWMDSSNCTLTKNSQPITAPLFIPTLDTAKSTCQTSKKMMKLTLVGTLLMPCDLHLEVFSVEANKAETGAVQSLDLSSIGMDWTETSVTVELNETADFPNLKREHEWHGRLAFGLGTDRTSWMRVKLSASDERKAQAKAAMKWLIPLIAGLAALLIFFLILLVLLRKRKKNKEQKKTKLSEMGEINQPMDDVIVKFEDNSADMTDQINRFPFDTPTRENKIVEDTHVTHLPIPPDQPPDREEGRTEQKAETTVIARGPDGNEVHVARTKDTLYNRLHGPQPDEQLNRPQMRVQLVAALTAVHKHSPSAELLTRLNPHVVFFDSAGVVCLQVNQHPQPQASDRGNQTKREEEFDRWKAPEVANGEVKVDHQQAAVFSLGLLFWEIETGMVPFRELDAVNAQRQLGTGQLPPMDRITSESLVEMIEQCLDLEAENRPTLAELEKMLSPPSLHQPSQPLSRKPVPLVNKMIFS
ncbi:hypothetical protein BLNAU_1410 [Blattamonas nauphoetae]|uniref:Protein kinase domain-containing protein n=1 Tax=Blattamonas nauphoetae TaxID=2049346 RepID=A0ABQ9YJA3_9EUKA|nr:hypothetical protein BLNAU_1410 [Blattamonas nauphoetae]